MNFTFGIITDGSCPDRIKEILSSIDNLGIDPYNYEKIIVGGSEDYGEKHIPFDENVKKSWITRKKNIIAEDATQDNLVILHDYIKFMPDWYDRFVDFGDDWDVAMCRIENADGRRFRDWVNWDGGVKYLDYNDHSKTSHMYVSGALMIVKTEFMLQNPLDEDRCWGQSEDVEWSLRVRDKWNYKCNPKSVVRFLKMKPHYPPSPE